MQTLAPAHRGWRRLLALLMLAMALLPAASRAWAAGQGGDWVEICSAQGTRWVSLSTGEPGEPDFKAMAEPCAACHLQLQGLGLPPAAFTLPLLAPRLEAPAAFLHAPQRLPIWRSACPRGPPLAGLPPLR